MTDRVGQQLGNYQLVRLLGEGGFAEVYLGEHIHLGTHAAIKILSAKLQRDESDHFREEARTIARLKHPAIVRILDFGVESGIPFLVMDYAPNGTLRHRHPKGTRLAPRSILPYVRQVASALQFAHDQKLIHRDVKPENMLLGERGEVLLSDFGIAIVSQSSHYQNTQDSAGTLAYMAPEQIQAHPRPASDQYSLGIVTYEWLAGERPFTGSMSEILAKQISVPPPPLRDKLPNLSPALEQVVFIALAKDPHQRFPSVYAFATAFEQACQKEGAFSVPTQVIRQPAESTPPVPITPFTPSSLPAQGQANHSQRAPSTRIPSPAPKAPTRPTGGTSRRTLLLTGGALAGLVIIGGGILLTVSQGRPGNAASASPTAGPTASPQPSPTTNPTAGSTTSPQSSPTVSPRPSPTSKPKPTTTPTPTPTATSTPTPTPTPAP